MSDHSPLTCRKCSPEPWAQAELTSNGKTRRFTGWAAWALIVGPIALVGFVLGVTVGVVLMAAAR